MVNCKRCNQEIKLTKQPKCPCCEKELEGVLVWGKGDNIRLSPAAPQAKLDVVFSNSITCPHCRKKLPREWVVAWWEAWGKNFNEEISRRVRQATEAFECD